jgi:hypothetical protein
MIVDNRHQLNTAGGYWALSVDAGASDHTRRLTIDPTTVDRLSLFSDSFERIFQVYDTLEYSNLFELVDYEGITAPFEKLGIIDSKDSFRDRYSRIATSQDIHLGSSACHSLSDPQS